MSLLQAVLPFALDASPFLLLVLPQIIPVPSLDVSLYFTTLTGLPPAVNIVINILIIRPYRRAVFSDCTRAQSPNVTLVSTSAAARERSR